MYRKTVIAKCYKSKAFYPNKTSTFFDFYSKRRLVIKSRKQSSTQINIVWCGLRKVLPHKKSFVYGLWVLLCFESRGVNLLSWRQGYFMDTRASNGQEKDIDREPSAIKQESKQKRQTLMVIQTFVYKSKFTCLILFISYADQCSTGKREVSNEWKRIILLKFPPGNTRFDLTITCFQ